MKLRELAAPIDWALRRTVRIATDRPRATLWTLAAVTCALFAIGLAALAADHVGRWTAAPTGSASMVVYLGDGVDPAHAAELTAQLGAMPGVDRAELVTPAESAHRLEQALGADATLIDGVEQASLPGSVEVTLAPGVRDVIAMSPTVRALRGTPGVDDVVVETAGADRTESALATVQLVAWTAAALIGALLVVIAIAAIRIRLDRPANELAVAELLGASPSFTIVPTALAGAIQGALAAVLAAAAVCAVVALYGDAIATEISGPFGSIELAMPAAFQLALFVALGGLLGLFAGGLAGARRASR